MWPPRRGFYRPQQYLGRWLGAWAAGVAGDSRRTLGWPRRRARSAMPRIIDLSMAIEDHFRWPVERRLNSDHAQGDLFQATWLGWPVHGFTHMDSPRHFFADRRTTSDVPLEATVGDAAVVDLTPL